MAPPQPPGIICADLHILIRCRLVDRLQMLNLMTLNRLKERQRVAHGKPAKLHDLSMTKHFEQSPNQDLEASRAGPDSGPKLRAGNAPLSSAGTVDLTDRENDEFQYIL